MCPLLMIDQIVFKTVLLVSQQMDPAFEAILGHKSAHSLATGPVMAEPFISPLLLTITPALSSKYMNCPSFLLNVFLWRITTAGITFLRSSGFPFLTVARTMSPLHAAGSLLSLPLIPYTAITYRFLPPVLSAQFITAPTGQAREILNLAPAAPPRPLFDMVAVWKGRWSQVQDLSGLPCW